MIISYKNHTPEIDESAFVAENATVAGKVKVAENASIWFGAVLRADMQPITVGKNSNVQDNAVIHVGPTSPTVIGEGVTIGHGAIVHSATIGNNVLVGMGSIILDGAVIGDNCIIGAGALVTSGTVIPDNSMVLGMPGKVVKELNPVQIASNKVNAISYVKLGKDFKG